MKTTTPTESPLTRREALRRTLFGGLAAGAAAALPAAEAAPLPATQAEAPFVPENDYPFFGYDPDQSE